jgi:hypothetical protein
LPLYLFIVPRTYDENETDGSTSAHPARRLVTRLGRLNLRQEAQAIQLPHHNLKGG